MHKNLGKGEAAYSKAAAAVVLTLLLTACGGSGGDDPVTTDNGDTNNSGDTGGDNSSGSGSTTGGTNTTPIDISNVDCPSAPALVDTSNSATIVGDGSPSSCTVAALQTALSNGGVIRFNCGADDHVINVSSQLNIDKDVVLDGEGKVTLDGGSSSRILALNSTFDKSTPSLTVQRLTFQNGASNNTGSDTSSGGGAIYRVGGSLTVIDSHFQNNQSPTSGQDIAGGAIYSLGGGETVISGSTFSGNRASNGGALGNLHNDLSVINSSFDQNAATGTGGNPGNGGNGGGIYIDGVSQDVVMCGVQLTNNDANAFGGGLFRVSNDHVGSHDIDRSTIDGNVIPRTNSPSMAGGLYLQGVDINITNSTVSRNEAGHSGGLFIGPGSTLNILNSTIAENESTESLGGGMAISDGVTGLIKNVTLANNQSSDGDSFGAATVGGSEVTMQNTIVDGHVVGNGYNPISCRDSLIEGSGNIQFPVQRSGGGSDDPSSLCTNNVLVADPNLGALSDNGGETQTLLPGIGSPAIGIASDCPATDQRGQARSEPCTAGAVEIGL